MSLLFANSLLVISFLDELELICLHTSITIISTQLNGFNYCNLTLIILFNINHLFEHNEVITNIAISQCCILAFDPAKNAIPRWCTGRKWHILMAVMRGHRVGGNWLMKWDEVKKFPWYTHRLMHRKRVTSELHDSYFRWMTINHAIPKIE